MESIIRSFTKTLFLYAALSAGILGILLFSVLDSLPASPSNPSSQVVYSERPSLTTNTWGIFDVHTGEILEGSNIDLKRPIASITKLFTAEVVERDKRKDIAFTINYSDIAEEGRAGKLSYNESTTLSKLLFPLLLESSNDAAHAIERFLGTQYKKTITEIIDKNNLKQTFIDDSSGLSEKNVSTIQDLAHYFAHIKNDQPHILDITQLRTYITADNGYLNNNPARSFYGFSGGKHGYTEAAGRTLLASFKSDTESVEYGMVLLGSSDLQGDITALKSYGESIMHNSVIITRNTNPY